MEYRELGKTGIRVSRLCFGTLTLGHLQANLSIDEGGAVIAHAIDNGVNFFDTAELYDTYGYVREAMCRTKKDIVVSARSYAYTKEMARDSIEKARKELDRDVIDIFGLHEQESEHTIRGHWDAIEYFLEAKQKGIIKATLITTHRIEVVKKASQLNEIDIIHPIINKAGLGIGDGNINEMLFSVKEAHLKGKGIYSMKALGGGNLLGNYSDCMNFVMDMPYVDSIAVGMKNIDEVNLNIGYFSGNRDIDEIVRQNQAAKELHIDFWCERCGKCVDRCSHDALKIENDTVVIDKNKCLLCGYCASVCPQFAIKVF